MLLSALTRAQASCAYALIFRWEPEIPFGLLIMTLIHPNSLYRKNSTRASRNHTKFIGATEMGPLTPKMAIWNLSPALTGSASTTRLGMLKPWMVAGLG